MHSESAIREPLILGHKTYHDITADIVGPIENKAPRAWYVLLTISSLIALYGIGCIGFYLLTGRKPFEATRDADLAQQVEILHVPRADLDHVGELGHHGHLVRRHRFGAIDAVDLGHMPLR